MLKMQPLQGLRLHLDYSGTPGRRRGSNSESLDYAHPESAWASAYTAVAAGAALAASLGVFAFLRRSGEWSVESNSPRDIHSLHWEQQI